eukprot:CAMPEP_0204569148 /NCGR_PEP_ID=MMETSP0661-20131031/37585_1 /ASSEMBLY_ACC=CAM_ASM_000606 /TAXON_ID=109239 /ORGANISM="Alexandrium margalefi, Strain AMGDE01CS-322" /LENGTH=232 /DNA_ID=CAMNT_0051577231 /DNA_START=59 /DNA_END=757 /DNA_ORIENTATION=+
MARPGLVPSPALASSRAVARRRHSPLALCAGALLLALFGAACQGPAFAGAAGRPAQARDAAVARQASGFSEATAKKSKASDKKVLTPEDLEALHGDRWELVDAVFKGKKAASPEAIMRARFTALYYKDPGFLGATETDPDSQAPLRDRVKSWAVTLGLKEKTLMEKVMSITGVDTENLREADSFEVIEATDTEVEFKIRCRNGKTLHERSTFKEDKKYGYVFSGESAFGQWE